MLEKLRNNISHNPEASFLLNAWKCVHHCHASTVIPALTDLVAVVEHLKREANRTGGRIWSNTLAINPLVDGIVRILLIDTSDTTHTSGGPYDSDVALETGVRAAGLLFIAELRRHVAVCPVLNAHFVRVVAASLSQLDAMGFKWGVFAPLRFWMLAIGALEAEGEADRDRFIDELRMLRIGMFGKFGNFAKLTEVLEGVCWIREIHGPKLQQILGATDGAMV